MQTIPLQQAQSQLSEIVAQLGPGSEWIITDHDLPVARLLPAQNTPRQPRKPGSAIGILTIVEEGQEHLTDFKDYMP